MRAPIIAIKHYVQAENSVLTDGTRRTIDLIDSVGQAAVTATQDVVEGSIVKMVYFELWGKSNSVAGTETKFQLAIEKVPAAVTSLTFTEMNNLHAYQNKKNILYFTQGVTGDLTTASMALFRGWLKIPRGKQRWGLGDKLIAAISTTGGTLNNCGFATYKEFK